MFNRKDKATTEEAPQGQITDEQKVMGLRHDLEILQKSREELRAKFAEEEISRSGKKQLAAFDGKIEEKRKQIDQAGREILAKARDAILVEVNALVEEKKRLVERVEQIDLRGSELQREFEKNVVKIRHQISSKRLVKLEREMERVEATGIELGRSGKPIYSKKFDRVETIVPAIPRQIKRMIEGGWRIVKGEPPIEDEPLDSSNSIPMFVTPPEVFQEFLPDTGFFPVPVSMGK